MGDGRYKWTGAENDLIRSRREVSIQLCRLENHNCFCRNSEIANMDINSDNSARARTYQFRAGNDVTSSKLKLQHYNGDQCGKFYDTTNQPKHKEICENKTEKSESVATAERLKSHGKSFICPLCTKVVKGDRFNLATHIRSHTNEKPFICEVCNTGFVHSTNLRQHKRVHSGEMPYICQICSKRFTQQGNLKIHKRVHTGERPYICTMCSQGFTKKRSLEIHTMTHTGERPYSCTICTKQFKERSKLKRHKKTHEENKK